MSTPRRPGRPLRNESGLAVQPDARIDRIVRCGRRSETQIAKRTRYLTGLPALPACVEHPDFGVGELRGRNVHHRRTGQALAECGCVGVGQGRGALHAAASRTSTGRVRTNSQDRVVRNGEDGHRDDPRAVIAATERLPVGVAQ